MGTGITTSSGLVAEMGRLYRLIQRAKIKPLAASKRAQEMGLDISYPVWANLRKGPDLVDKARAGDMAPVIESLAAEAGLSKTAIRDA